MVRGKHSSGKEKRDKSYLWYGGKGKGDEEGADIYVKVKYADQGGNKGTAGGGGIEGLESVKDKNLGEI